ncbi:prephenate dehydratase [Actinoalloteichus sp. AHMU CJ021]|nr:prephenate dehydratase [Actinoalloteichus sp. AHMU CJ021]
MANMPRVVYLGPEGTFSEQAARALGRAEVLPGGSALAPSATIDEAVRAVSGTSDAEPTAELAVVPVENSVEGSVVATLDALSSGAPTVAVAETVLPVRFSVLTRPGTTLDRVRTVATHPHAAAQVRNWLAENVPRAAVLPSTSTAAAARSVRDGEVDASVSTPVAAEHYGLAAVAEDVADVRHAETRFLLLSRPVAPPPPTGWDRTSIAVVLPNHPGSLAGALHELALRDISLSRIESRPTRNRLGEYRFFLDLDGHVGESRMADGLAALRRRCVTVRFLGSFAKADAIPRVHGPDEGRHTSDEVFAEASAWVRAVREGREV